MDEFKCLGNFLNFFLGFAEDFMVERVQQRPDQVREPSLCQEQRSQSSQHGKLDRSVQIYYFRFFYLLKILLR